MPTQTFVSVIYCCQITPSIGIGTRYRYRSRPKVSVSEVAVNCGIGLTLPYSYWCLAEDSWIASSYLHHSCMPTDVAEGHIWPTVCWSHILAYHLSRNVCKTMLSNHCNEISSICDKQDWAEDWALQCRTPQMSWTDDDLCMPWCWYCEVQPWRYDWNHTKTGPCMM